RIEDALERTLGVDATGTVGKQRPRDGVKEEDGPSEKGDDEDDTADDERVEARVCGDATGDTGEPAVVRAGNAGGADPVEEGRGRRRGRTGRSWCARGERCVVHDLESGP